MLSIWEGNGQSDVVQTLNLEECIAIAMENNFDVKGSRLRSESSKVNYKQARNELLPNLNMNYNLGVNDGRSIDPFTNSYSNQQLTFSNLGANLNFSFFNGFRLLNSIKQSRFNMQAAEMELEEAKQDLKLNVTIGYILILNNRDLVTLAKSRLEATNAQLNRLKARYDSGAGNPVDYTDMKGQYALDQAAIYDAENRLKFAVLEFIRLLNIESNGDKDVENISGLIESGKYQLSAAQIYEEALQNLATFKAKQFRIDAAEKGIKVAKSDYFPEVSLFGQLNTNYSSLAKTFTETGTSIIETTSFVNIANQDYPVFESQTQFDGSKINYEDQFNNNLNSVVGVSVRVPLFNGFRAKNNVELQRVQLEESKLDLENTQLLFKQSIEQAYNNMETAYNRYYAVQDQVAAFEESFRVNEVRFNNGVSNIVEYITSKNNIDNAQLNLNKAKYEYILRIKILDYYRGV
ncbi:TolC family protein [uncultured Algibacter sp.]|uniref:TolC family protein n=1 Tax=uncultured Algibacter sp. TaxID=298659 RepID=UPI0026056E8C|nr:TolC family protein [uncultured Algibacter sp.]